MECWLPSRDVQIFSFVECLQILISDLLGICFERKEGLIAHGEAETRML